MTIRALPRQRVVDRAKPIAPYTIPDPDFRFERGNLAFQVVYGALPQDPPYYALSPRMPMGGG